LMYPNRQFFNDYFEVCIGDYVLKDKLVEVYNGWCEEHLYPPSSLSILTKNFRKFSKGEVESKRVSIDGKRIWVYNNIRFNDEHNGLNVCGDTRQSDLMSLEEKRSRYE